MHMYSQVARAATCARIRGFNVNCNTWQHNVTGVTGVCEGRVGGCKLQYKLQQHPATKQTLLTLCKASQSHTCVALVIAGEARIAEALLPKVRS